MTKRLILRRHYLPGKIDGQGYDNFSTLARCACHFYGAAVQENDMFDNREAQAGAAELL
jgi:hypothetical protein